LLSFFSEFSHAEAEEQAAAAPVGPRNSTKRDSISDHLDTTMIRLLIDSLKDSSLPSADEQMPSAFAEITTPMASVQTNPSSPGKSSLDDVLSFRDALMKKEVPSSSSSQLSSSQPSSTSSDVLLPSDTTVMLRNVPYEARQLGVLALVEESGFKSRFSFFYCPLDFRSLNNLGYAFIVFDDCKTAKEFYRVFDSKRIKRAGWDKELKVGRARIQHLQPNIEHYRNSPVNLKSDEFKPMLFTEDGMRTSFPGPDRNSSSSAAAAAGGLNKISEERGSSGMMFPNGHGSSVRPRERRLQVSSAGQDSKVKSVNRVFVGGLSSGTTSENLYEFLGQFGRVLDAQVLFDPGTGKSRTYGFATYANEASAQAALDAGSLNLDGRTVVVRKYTAKTIDHVSHIVV